MTTLTRREFGALTLGAIALPRLAAAQTVGGVRLGVQTYSFRELPRTPEVGRVEPTFAGNAVQSIIAAMKTCGLSECELWSPQIERQQPGGRGRSREEIQQAREMLRRERVNTPLDHFRAIRQAFAKDGLSIYAYNYSFGSDFTDEEINRGFEMARALGAEIITASTTLSVAKRVVPFAEKHKMAVAVHNHSNTKDPNEFATPASFAAAMALSKYFKVNLDIGHFTAANYDPIAYLREHHADITNLHLKDRKRDQGDNTPWGTGDTKIKEVLALLKREKWPIRAYIEYEYRGESGATGEVKKCLDYAKSALA
jgi:sugar phosphate isomerase/epimerase